MNFQILLKEYLHYQNYIRGLSPHTIKKYHENISYFIRHSEIRILKEINETIIQKFFTYGRIERLWSSNTFLIYHSTLSTFFDWLVSEGYLKINFIHSIEKPQYKVLPKKKLNTDEATRILETVQNYPYSNKFLKTRNIALIAVLLFTGARKSELLNLKVQDIDMNNLSLNISTSKRNGFRLLPIPIKLNKILHEYFLERKVRKKTCPEFFCSQHRNSGFTDSGLKRVINDIKKASGISFSCHILRHTFATLMFESGCDIFSLSKMMGHKDIHTTCIYLAATKRHLTKQMNSHPLV